MYNLSLEVINKTTPYKVKYDQGEYVFETETGSIYNISFDEDLQIAGNITYQFCIRRHIIRDKSFDSRVQQTIIAIILEFFKQDENILLYTCDNSDNREAARSRLFLRWFNEVNTMSGFVLKSANTVVEGQGFYFAIIIPRNHPSLEAICSEFDEVAAHLTSNK